jgi:murein DD-endopeptidase MepM/ murein hydrolase activator NlpD
VKVAAAALAIWVGLCVAPGASARPADGKAQAKTSAKSASSSRKPAKTHKHPKKAKTKKAKKHSLIVTQETSGQVVLKDVEADKLPVYGPFLPSELAEVPEPVCEPVDALLEARVHEPDQETPEAITDDGEERVDRAASSPALALIAQKFSSFFRPKSSNASVRPQDVDVSELLSQGFEIPVEGVDVERLKDSFLARRGRGGKHLAIDIGAPRGTAVLATTDGEIVRISRERKGGKTIYQKDTSGQYLLFYCHLSKYAEDLAVGKRVSKGEVIGYVGSTGHVIGGPHLHFSITRLPDDAGSFKRGLAINPYLLFLAGVP